ncbi:unnamed protein product [Brassica oleracea]
MQNQQLFSPLSSKSEIMVSKSKKKVQIVQRNTRSPTDVAKQSPRRKSLRYPGSLFRPLVNDIVAVEQDPYVIKCTHEDLKLWIEQQFKQLASAFQKQIGELGEICAAVAVVYLKVNKVHTPSYADIEIHDVNEDANAVSPRFHRTDAVESTFKEQTPIHAAPLLKRFKDDEPVGKRYCHRSCNLRRQSRL